MNINITPSAVAVDTAANLLSFLEMVKDPSKLLVVLDQIKTAQSAAEAQTQEAKKAQADAEALKSAAQAEVAKAADERAKIRDEAIRAANAITESDAVRDAVKGERQRFDQWMAEQREKLSADLAKVNSDSAGNAHRTAELKVLEAAAASREQAADDMLRTADAQRVQYEQKISALKSII